MGIPEAEEARLEMIAASLVAAAHKKKKLAESGFLVNVLGRSPFLSLFFGTGACGKRSSYALSHFSGEGLLMYALLFKCLC